MRALVREIFDVFAILPLPHALIVSSACQAPAHAVWIADVHLPNTLLGAKVHHQSRALVAQVAHLSSYPGAHRAAGAI